MAAEMGLDPMNVMPMTTSSGKRTKESKGQQSKLPKLIANTQGAFLNLSEKLYDSLSEEERRALIGHELSHIRNYDSFTHLFYRVSVFGGLSIAIKQLMTPKYNHFVKKFPIQIYASTIAYIMLGIVTQQRLSRFMEKRADRESAVLLNCGKGAISLLERIRQENLQERKSFIGRIFFDNAGNDRFDFGHPKLTDRIAYLRKLSTNRPWYSIVMPAS